MCVYKKFEVSHPHSYNSLIMYKREALKKTTVWNGYLLLYNSYHEIFLSWTAVFTDVLSLDIYWCHNIIVYYFATNNVTVLSHIILGIYLSILTVSITCSLDIKGVQLFLFTFHIVKYCVLNSTVVTHTVALLKNTVL